jgi:hypothetical protein
MKAEMSQLNIAGPMASLIDYQRWQLTLSVVRLP